MPFLIPRYDPALVALSILIATLASYVALDLAQRVRSDDALAARGWWIGGSLAMGTGIWSMHFVGMLAYELAMPLGYTHGLTLLSWVAAVAVSAIALGVAGRRDASWRHIALAAPLMGLGICAMHYTGMAALDMAPGIVWDGRLVAASALIAVVASAAALAIFLALRRVDPGRVLPLKMAAAVVMGAAITGMHYTGMAAAAVPVGAVCLSAGALGGSRLGTLVTLASLCLLGLTSGTAWLEGRAQRRTHRLARSLQSAHAQLQSANDELNRLALQDPLTGLPNRLLFEDRLQHAVARCERADGDRLAVLFLNIDGFKAVNDSLGHGSGDALLQQAAHRLRALGRDSDTRARLGADEFVLLMEALGNVADAVALAQRALQAFRAPFDLGGRPIHLSASVGIALHPEHGPGPRLLANADAAMASAKRMGGNTYALFEPRMDAGALEQLTLQNDLRRAVERGQLRLHYQPKVNSHGGWMSGVEALLRWQHPERGQISPVVFIPLAERYGMIQELGNWVIDEACRQLQAWRDEGLGRLRMAINLSVHQLRQDDLAARIDAALKRYQLKPAQLLCEITETVAMEDLQATQRAFAALQAIGVYLSIDDFGTGYSSLSTLRQLPARQLKIDRSFVKDLGHSADAGAVVDAVIRLAHALGLVVVAEGVETETQRDILLQLQCDELQGYLFARPMDAQALQEWVLGETADATPGFVPTGIDPSWG